MNLTKDTSKKSNSGKEIPNSYPVWDNWEIEMIPIHELSEDYKRNQIRWMTNKIKEYEYLISLIK